MLRKIFAGLVLVAVTVVSVTSYGSNINLSLGYAGSFNGAFEPLPGSPPGPLNPMLAPNPVGAPFATPVAGAYHQFDVFMTITNTDGSGTTGEDFQSVIFDMILGPGVTASDVGWSGVSDSRSTYDPTGPAPTASLYGTNTDAGTNSTDMKAITVIASSASTFQGTHFRHPGEAEAVAGGGTNTALGANTMIGSVFVHWDGTVDVSNKSWVGISLPENVANPWSTVTLGDSVAHAAATMTVGARMEWEIEGAGGGNTAPSIIAPAAVGGVSQGAQLLGDFNATDTETPGGPFTFSGLALASFTPQHPAWPIPNPDFLSNASIDPATGVVTWDTTGFRRGVYDIIANVADGEGLSAANNPGHWQVTITQVPEPATLSMFGLALLGFVGMARRRS